MKPWEIWDYEFPWGRHPAIIVSSELRVERKSHVVVLSCSTQRATRDAIGLEAVVDKDDGLDWKTIVRCDLFYTVPKADLKNCRGRITFERRRDIQRKMFNGLAMP